MPLPHYLQGTIDMLRSEIERADFLTAKILGRNVAAHLTNLAAYVELSDDLRRAFDITRHNVGGFAAMVAAKMPLGEVGRAAVEKGRAEALEAVDQLEAALERSEPNDRARALFG